MNCKTCGVPLLEEEHDEQLCGWCLLDQQEPFEWTDELMDSLNHNNMMDAYEGEAYIDQ